MLAVAITLAVRLVRTRRLLRRAGLPTNRRWVVWAALVYLVLPTDLLPDPVYLDDIGVLLLALRSLTSDVPPRVLAKASVPVRRAAPVPVPPAAGAPPGAREKGRKKGPRRRRTV
ncbi:YkvA family protein [Streptomyces fuscigenes]|uniref:YkvA family protein n=1 Tax=Streptomyces fuscigenes TaxID=1528880 RepID=UPI003555ED4A